MEPWPQSVSKIADTRAPKFQPEKKARAFRQPGAGRNAGTRSRSSASRRTPSSDGAGLLPGRPGNHDALYRINYICTLYMKSLLIQIDELTLHALNRIAPAAQRKRAEFVRTAIRKAIREAEEERTRNAYLQLPDTDTVADDWSNAEEWKR
jgi:hypothetical protein